MTDEERLTLREARDFVDRICTGRAWKVDGPALRARIDAVLAREVAAARCAWCFDGEDTSKCECSVCHPEAMLFPPKAAP